MLIPAPHVVHVTNIRYALGPVSSSHCRGYDLLVIFIIRNETGVEKPYQSPIFQVKYGSMLALHTGNLFQFRLGRYNLIACYRLPVSQPFLPGVTMFTKFA